MKKNGFSLVEMMVALLIIGLISAAATVSISTFRQKSRDTQRLADLKQIQVALELYRGQEGTYPPSLNFGQALVGPTSQTTFMAKVPNNPIVANISVCTPGEYSYSLNNYRYQIDFCLEQNDQGIIAGYHCLDNRGLLNGTCASNTCTPDCSGKCTGGDNGCGGTCSNSCSNPYDTCSNGTCIPCSPDCSGKCTGADDSCGGTCTNACSGNDICSNGTCIPCVPDCSGKNCGNDGCGGSCGTCGSGEACINNNCAPFSCNYQINITSIAGHTCNTGAPDYDTCTYDTVQIGSQCWLARDLNIGTMVCAGEPWYYCATDGTDNGVLEKHCQRNNVANCQNHGGLYQWDEAMQYTSTEGGQGICPAGWHIPSDAELYTLENSLTNPGQTCDPNRTTTYDCYSAGAKLWTGGSTGFNAGYNGYYGRYNNTYYNYTDTFNWWSSSIVSGYKISRFIYPVGQYGKVYRVGSNGQTHGFSVRCLKD